MKKYILETLLQEAVKISRQGEVKDMPLVDLVKQVLEQTNESEVLTQAENDALMELRRLEPINLEFKYNPNPEVPKEFIQPLPEDFPYKNCMIGIWPSIVNVDVVKVIEDLVAVTKKHYIKTSEFVGIPEVEDALQNAEAAIGMINAFKQHDHGTK